MSVTASGRDDAKIKKGFDDLNSWVDSLKMALRLGNSIINENSVAVDTGITTIDRPVDATNMIEPT